MPDPAGKSRDHQRRILDHLEAFEAIIHGNASKLKDPHIPYLVITPILRIRAAAALEQLPADVPDWCIDASNLLQEIVEVWEQAKERVQKDVGHAQFRILLVEDKPKGIETKYELI